MRDRRVVVTGLILAAGAFGGCAPTQFGARLAYEADQHQVRDASVRRHRRIVFLRFNELALSDLDDAIRLGRGGNDREMRRLASHAVRAAQSLGLAAAESEIDRLPAAGRSELARLAPCENTPAAIKRTYGEASQAAATQLLNRIDGLPTAQCLRELESLRRDVEPAADDEGRLLRQVALAWAAVPAWLGVSKVDADLERKRLRYGEKVFDHAVAWAPHVSSDAFADRLAPVIVMEWPEKRDYPADYDRFGEVYLTGRPDDIRVNINASHPLIYWYASEAKVRDRRHRQYTYVWWFPERPPMKDGDPVAGSIDGDTLRITLDSAGRPGVFEVVQSCGCGHLVYVSRRVEEDAKKEFGGVEPGKRLAVERSTKTRRDLIVSGCVDVPDDGVRPVVYIVAGYHEVAKLETLPRDGSSGTTPTEKRSYDLAEYAALSRLPLGGGVASMFGADGLVHNAGRAEGYLLAPTGILSAGQPRIRGTQKIRWDDYSLDDPRLLENTLRLPSSF